MSDRVLEREQEPLPAEPNKYDLFLSFYKEHVDRQHQARKIQRDRDLPWTHHRHATVKYYLGMWMDDVALRNWVVFVQGIKTFNGKHRHQGGLALFILEGKGYTVVNGERHDWEAGDLVLLPILPEFCEHQHFNLDPDNPSKFLAIIYLPFMLFLGGEFHQVENRPDFIEELKAGRLGDREEM